MSLADHIKALKKEGWELKYAFIVFVKLHHFCLSIPYVVHPCHPYIERGRLSD